MCIRDRLIFAFRADGGWYVRVEPFGAGAVRQVDQFEVYYCEGRPAPEVRYEPIGVVGEWARAVALLPHLFFGWCPRLQNDGGCSRMSEGLGSSYDLSSARLGAGCALFRAGGGGG
eukprot:12760900-Alexandrium_andersonii.AAC.1